MYTSWHLFNLCLLLSFVFTMPTPSSTCSATCTAVYHRPKIILLGDSLTQTSFEGWGATLANVYQRRADVINRGCSGYNTEFYLRLPMEDFVCDQSLVLIFFGANDAAIKEHDAHHHVSVERFQENLKTLIDRVRTKYPHCQEDTNILLITPPPVQHQQRLQFQKQKYGDKATGVLERTLENTGRYAVAVQSVAKDNNLPCLNLYLDMQQEPNWDRFFHDGLHFSADGHAFVGNAVLNAIHQHFPAWKVTADPWTGQWCNSGSSCTGLSSAGPYHDEIDHENIDEAFERHFADSRN